MKNLVTFLLIVIVVLSFLNPLNAQSIGASVSLPTVNFETGQITSVAGVNAIFKGFTVNYYTNQTFNVGYLMSFERGYFCREGDDGFYLGLAGWKDNVELIGGTRGEVVNFLVYYNKPFDNFSHIGVKLSFNFN